jgi:hypothetical protein
MYAGFVAASPLAESMSEETTEMKKLLSYFTAALTALTLGILSLGASAQAQPLAAAKGALIQDMVSGQAGLRQNVQYYPERHQYRDRYNNGPRHWNGPRYRDRPGWNHNRPNYRPHYRPYYQQPYRPYYQPQYRPAPPRHYRERSYRSGSNAHINWCYNRYRSYRASDNTFQPNYGPRRQCYSPYI